MQMTKSQREGFDVAVVGMAGRFPGARSLKEYWNNLLNGIETIRPFSEAELLRRGVDPEELRDPNFVPAAALVPDSDQFAASFFGYSATEAELMDPQHRLFLECAWEALEDAGYALRSQQTLTGVFAGTGLSTYMLFNLLTNADVCGPENVFQAMIGSDKDFLSTRLSYKLNFRGPSLTVQTGCSTSMVAIHLAIQNLLTYHCDVAVAGGVAVGVPQRTGYLYQPFGIASPDGHCRAFDAAAAGTVFGEGVGVVILKRLEDAVKDRDNIYAVVLGSAINNDGSAKIGFTAPSVEGQTEVILKAQAVADVSADTVSYVEAHGTATALGDPAEVAALTQAFRRTTKRCKFCGLGTVKSNIGHLDAAAGIAGFIKTVLMLHHRRLVPSLFFETPNPKIDFENSPFYVVLKAEEWKAETKRRAGVSSFGIGGTNVHVILEEAPDLPSDFRSKSFHILSLSAQTKTGLNQATTDLTVFLESCPDESLADAAYTLQVGREPFKHRRSIICRNRLDALDVLGSLDRTRIFDGSADEIGLKVGFIFPGGASQYPNMGRGLYDEAAEFRRQVDICSELLVPDLGFDLRSILYPPMERTEASARQLERPSVGLPAIFTTEYALARLLMSWGIKPFCMLGHSLGEYAAACLAGVFSLEAALALVALRGRLLEALPSGSMLSVHLAEQEVRPFLDSDISIAAINSPDQCVVSGPSDAIERVSSVFAAKNIEFQKLHISAAAHSPVVEPAMKEFHTFLAGLQWGDLSIPFISTLTGTWINASQAKDPNYWTEHLRRTVRFSAGISQLLSRNDLFVLEVGPGRTLTTLARNQAGNRSAFIHSTMRSPPESVPDVELLYTTVGRMWNGGLPLDWNAFYGDERRRRISLPTYPFERERYWVEPGKSTNRSSRSRNKRSPGPQVYVPSWEVSPLVNSSPVSSTRKTWLLLLDEFGLGDALSAGLRTRGDRVVTVRRGSAFHELSNNCFEFSQFYEPDFERVFEHLGLQDANELNVVHLWGLPCPTETSDSIGSFYQIQRDNSFCLIALCKTLNKMASRPTARIFVVTSGLAQVGGDDVIWPEISPLAGVCKVAAEEYDNITCRVLDFTPMSASRNDISRRVEQILSEVVTDRADWLTAYRGCRRWVPTYKQVEMPTKGEGQGKVQEGGVYLITGGLGDLGPIIAESFATRTRCTLIFTGRSVLPAKGEWNDWLRTHSNQDPTSRTILALQSIEAKGSETVLFRADVADRVEMATVFNEIESRFGKLHGVIHLAGVTDQKALRLMSDLDETECEAQFNPKIAGCYVLRDLLKERSPDFCVLFSSTASFLGGAGMAAYAAANCFLDAFATSWHLVSGQRWISINWDAWVTDKATALLESGQTALNRFAIEAAEAVDVLNRVLAAPPGQYIVSTGDVQSRIDESLLEGKAGAPSDSVAATHARPTLAVEYAAPTTTLQQEVAEIWSEVLGVEKVGLHDNLFELGGNSLIGLRIISKLKQKMDKNLPITALFEAPTVLQLSRLLQIQPLSAEYPASRHRGEMRRQKRDCEQPIAG
jgi:acyl transferase domain-containing protein